MNELDEKTKRAFKIWMDFPFSVRRGGDLSEFLINETKADHASLDGVRGFARQHHLSQRKVCGWLERHAITSDSQLLSEVYQPIAMRFEEYIASHKKAD